MSDEIRLVGDPGGSPGPDGGSGRIQVRWDVLDEIDDHVESDTTVEQGGVLVGDVHEPSGTTVITARIPAVGAISEVASLRFTHETWDHVNTVLERDHPGRRMVGWYHSHPHFGIFLSEYDQFIHHNFFREPWQVAYVVDPLLGQRGFFAWVDGELVRVPSWQTWRTEAAPADAPVGTPPVRPATPPPAPPPPGAPPTGPPGSTAHVEPAGAPHPARVSRWSLGLLVLLAVALVAAVLVVVDPFAPDAPALRLVPDEAGLADRAVAGAVTPLGVVILEGADKTPAEALSWAYHPTDGSTTPPDAIVAEATGDEHRFRLGWRSGALADTGARRGEVRVTVCDDQPTGDEGCPADRLEVASLPISLAVEAHDPDTGLSLPDDDRFLEGPGVQAYLPDERLVAVPSGTSQSDSPEGLPVIGRQASGSLTVLQLDVGGAPAGVDPTGDTLTGAPHVAAAPDVPSGSPEGVSDEARAAIAAGETGTTGGAVTVAFIAPPDRADRALTLACGAEGVSAACAPTDAAALPGPGRASLAAVVEAIAAVPAGAVAALLVDLPDATCPDKPADLTAAVSLEAELVRDRADVLWVVPDRNGCRDLGDELDDDANVVTVHAEDHDTTAGVTAPFHDLLDATAVVAGAAADVWSTAVGTPPPALRDCLVDEAAGGIVQVEAARAACTPATGAPAPATPAGSGDNGEGTVVTGDGDPSTTTTSEKAKP